MLRTFTPFKYTVAQQFATRYITISVTSPNNAPEDQTLDYYRQNARAYADLPAKRWPPPFGRDVRHILDAGFGAGNHLAVFLEQGIQCDGFDGSEELVLLAKKRFQNIPENRLKLWQADFRMLKLPQETYDAIWANQIFTHIPPILCQRLMQSFFAAMKKRGRLFVSFETFNDPNSDQEFTHREDREGCFSRHYYAYPSQAFESLVRQSGFNPVAMGQDQDNPLHKAILAERV